jgi:glycosyltransferase involved in cell wall biosynthesis
MLVAINTLTTTLRPDSGHEDRYLKRVLDAMRRVQSDTQFVVLTHEGNHDFYAQFDRVAVAQGGGGLSAFRGGPPTPEKVAAQIKADVLLSQLDAAAGSSSVPQVLFALDLALWEPEPGKPANKHPHYKAVKKSCSGARAVIVPSEFLRRKCLEIFETPLNKVVVAHPGVEPLFQEPHGTMVEAPYFSILTDSLTASSMPRVREMLAQLEKEYPHTFVVVGRGGEVEPEEWSDRVVRIEQLPDNHLSGLYQNGDLLLYPALHDGSAMRILEGFMSGVAVVAPNSGATNELIGNAPYYYNPASTASMLQAVRRVLELDPAEKAERLRLNRNSASKYSWEKCAWRFISAFKKVA